MTEARTTARAVGSGCVRSTAAAQSTRSTRSTPRASARWPVCQLAIDRPQVVAIIGSSGAGKSTLIRCINRLVEPTAGSIELRGENVVTLDRAALRAARRRIGMIFQEFNLVERLTVMQNVLAGRLGYVGLYASLRYRFPPRGHPRRLRVARSGRARRLSRPTRRRTFWRAAPARRASHARSCSAPNCCWSTNPLRASTRRPSRQIMRLIRELASERATPALVNIHDVGTREVLFRSDRRSQGWPGRVRRSAGSAHRRGAHADLRRGRLDARRAAGAEADRRTRGPRNADNKAGRVAGQDA